MKKLLLSLSALALTFSAAGQGIVFEELTVEEAVAKAKAENRHVFVDVYTDWCGPCRMMSEQVFTLPEVGDYFNAKFVNLKLNAEKGDIGPAFKAKHGIRAYPTFVVLDGDGQVVHLFTGGVPGVGFIDKVAEAFDPAKAFGFLKRRYDAGERDPKFVASYLEALQSTYIDPNINELLDEFYASIADDDKISAEALFLFDANAGVWSEKDDFLTEHRDLFRRRAGRERVDEVFKRKYYSWYSDVLTGRETTVTLESIGKTNDRLSSLGLTDAAEAVLAPLRDATLAKLTGEGADEVFELVLRTVPGLSDDELNSVIFHVAFGLKDMLDDEQKDRLVEMATNDDIKTFITRAIAPRQSS
jgi:thiol-disulfide isomerase/thioredoxin